MITFLILAAIVLGLLAVTRLSRVYELTAELRGQREEEISDRESKMNSRLLWAFPFAYFGFFLWLTVHYHHAMLPVSASEHGVWLDDLLNFNWVILVVVFFITNILLFYFAGKYYHRSDRRAYYYPHNNKWELGWTIVPAVVMISIIIYGLRVWDRITSHAPPGTPEVELYAQQFKWMTRYPGPDGRLGATDFRLINATNEMGIVTPASISTRLTELAEETATVKKRLATEGDHLPADKVVELEDRIKHLERMSGKIINLRTLMDRDIAEKKAKGERSQYEFGADDLVLKEFHLPVGQDVLLVIRSQDVIHSAYIPHLRTQMNAVPGMTTVFHMTPTITKNEAFDFVLLCNKICGASHYNMQMPLVVEPTGDYAAWLARQKGFETAEPAKAEAPVEATTTTVSVAAATNVPNTH